MASGKGCQPTSNKIASATTCKRRAAAGYGVLQATPAAKSIATQAKGCVKSTNILEIKNITEC
jgi:hypothetical protein